MESQNQYLKLKPNKTKCLTVSFCFSSTPISENSGTVSAKIQGGDLTAIDPTSIVLFESDPAAAVVPVGVPGITGNHLRARFAKSEAFLMLADPQSGETRSVAVRFVAAGALVDLPAEIQIVGPPL